MSSQTLTLAEYLRLVQELGKVCFPDYITIGNRPLFEKWMSTLPSGTIRNDSVNSYYSGLESAKTTKTPEIDLSIGNLGALQRWLDNWDVTYKNYPVEVKNRMKVLLTKDSKGLPILNTKGFCQFTKDLGWLHAEYERVKGYINDIVKPGPGPGPNPSPYSGDPKKDAEDYFNKTYQEEYKKSSNDVYGWLGKIISDSQSQMTKYSMIKPQTPETKYFLEYYEALYSIAISRQPDIQEKEDSKKFWADYKWWIIGGGVAIGGIVYFVYST